MNHNQEEADTSIVLHAIDVIQRDPSTDLVISCSDTDVLLILLNYLDSISLSTIFRTSSHDIPLRFAYEKLGEVKCKALLGIYALTGCDQSGKFYGFSKLSCWKTFSSSSPLQHFLIFVLNLYYKKINQ